MKKLFILSLLMSANTFPMWMDSLIDLTDEATQTIKNCVKTEKINAVMKATKLSLSEINELSKTNEVLLRYLSDDSISINDLSGVLSSLKK